MIYTHEQIAKIIEPVAKKYQLPAVYLFGSYARGQATEQSDIDLLVDTAGTNLTSLFSLGALYNDLEAVLGKPFDLVTLNSLTQRAQLPSQERFYHTVWKEKVKLYAIS